MEQRNIWYTADTHFGADSNDIIKREMRPFQSIAKYTMNQVLIWNKQVSPNDIIYFLGDFCNYNSQETDYNSGLAISKQIKAHIILLIGNSEERVIQAHFDGDFHRFREHCLNNYNFDDVKKDEYTFISGIQFFLTHKPINHDPHCLNLFGHTHRAGGLWRPYGFNVGVDLNHFRLYNNLDIMNLVEQKHDYLDNDPDINCF